MTLTDRESAVDPGQCLHRPAPHREDELGPERSEQSDTDGPAEDRRTSGRAGERTGHHGRCDDQQREAATEERRPKIRRTQLNHFRCSDGLHQRLDRPDLGRLAGRDQCRTDGREYGGTRTGRERDQALRELDDRRRDTVRPELVEQEAAEKDPRDRTQRDRGQATRAALRRGSSVVPGRASYRYRGAGRTRARGAGRTRPAWTRPRTSSSSSRSRRTSRRSRSARSGATRRPGARPGRGRSRRGR